MSGRGVRLWSHAHPNDLTTQSAGWFKGPWRNGRRSCSLRCGTKLQLLEGLDPWKSWCLLDKAATSRVEMRWQLEAIAATIILGVRVRTLAGSMGRKQFLGHVGVPHDSKVSNSRLTRLPDHFESSSTACLDRNEQIEFGHHTSPPPPLLIADLGSSSISHITFQCFHKHVLAMCSEYTDPRTWRLAEANQLISFLPDWCQQCRSLVEIQPPHIPLQW